MSSIVEVVQILHEFRNHRHDISDAKLDQDYYKRRLGTPLRPVYGKGPLGESLEIFGDIPRVRIRMTTL